MSSIFLGTRLSRAVYAAAATEFAAKVESLLPGATIVGNGVKRTAAQVEAVALAYVAAVQATNTARANLHSLVAAEAAALATLKDAVRSVLAFVVSSFGEGSSVFSGLGFTVKKLAKKTAAAKALAVVKGKATREERHTMGKRQKAGIHGTVSSPPAMSVVKNGGAAR
jgi:hypothetical protein